MQYRMLGRSGLSVSVIGFGCMSLGGDEADAARVIHGALERGINFFDTADLYEKGLNEERVGRILHGKREGVILATKVGNRWRDDGSGWDWNPRKEYIVKAVEGSLRRLRTDRIDLYQLHGGTIADPIDETIEAFETLQQQGKIRCYGLSSIRPDVIREYIRRSRIVSVMMQYSLLDRRPEEQCLGLLEEAGIGVLARGTLAKGLLVDKPAVSYLGHSATEVERAADRVKQVAGVTRRPAQVAIDLVLGRSVVSSAVVGVRTMTQLEGVTGYNVPLLENERKLLWEAVPENRYEEHR